jgi:hypothetical protein
LKTLDEAEGSFRNVLKDDHPVFKSMEQIRGKAGASSGPTRQSDRVSVQPGIPIRK